MPLLVLKIDVDTYRGTREGVPQLVSILQDAKAGASFLFSLGPDHTGWALRRALRPGFFSKVSRTSVVEHYGIKTLLYGTLLPGPDIGKRCAPILPLPNHILPVWARSSHRIRRLRHCCRIARVGSGLAPSPDCIATTATGCASLPMMPRIPRRWPGIL